MAVGCTAEVTAPASIALHLNGAEPPAMLVPGIDAELEKLSITSTPASTQQCQPRSLSSDLHAASKCQLSITVRRQELAFGRMMALDWLDQYYYNHPHKLQRLGFRFAEALDPTIAAQSLKQAMETYPVVGSKVILDDGKAKFHFDAENVSVRLVHVKPEMLQDLEQLEELFDVFRQPSPDSKLNPLFAAFLFKTSSPHDGSALICGFQHCVGDAMSYALFMRRWSNCYELLSSESKLAPDCDMPPEVFSQYSLLRGGRPREADSPILRHFSFSDQDLQAQKDVVMKASEDGPLLTTNDILCAQCAIAIAPSRFQEAGGGDADAEVRINVMVDARQRREHAAEERGSASQPGRPATKADEWGNYHTDIQIFFAWRELLDDAPANVARVARHIHTTLHEQMRSLEDLHAFERARASRRPAPQLFCWNSWNRVGDSLRLVQFRSASPVQRHNLQELRWLNAAWVPNTNTVLVEPAVCVMPGKGDARLVLHVAAPQSSAEEEGRRLRRFWPSASVRED